MLYAAPAPFEYHFLTTSDGVKIRVGRFCGDSSAPENSNKIMLVLPGVVSRIERHEFLAKHYASLGFGVWVLDFRGQGGSQRLVENKQMIHVDDFSDYIRDVEALALWDKFKGKHISIFGHSMGGQVALQVLRKHPKIFELAVLEAPMVRIKTAPLPFFFAEPLAYIFKNWFGQGKQYYLGYGNYDPIQESFKYNRNCRDETLFDQHYFIDESLKELIPRDPSCGWVHSALSACQMFLNDLKSLGNVTTKVFLATAGDDKVLDTRHDATIVSALQKAAHRVYAGAWHCLMHDTLAIRRAYLKDVSAFLSNPDEFIHNNKAILPNLNLGWLEWFRGIIRI
jgi:lysophospholipase